VEGKRSLKRETTGEVYQERSASATALLSVVLGLGVRSILSLASGLESYGGVRYRYRSTDRSSVSRSIDSSKFPSSSSLVVLDVESSVGVYQSENNTINQ